MSAGEKVITVLRDRVELEHLVEGMLEIRSEEEFVSRARHIAESNAQVIPVILRGLQGADPRQLNVLGVVASLYPQRDEILNKLYETAADVERSDRERVSAMLILERFLDQEPDPGLLQSLEDPRAVAIESVKDLIRASEQEPSVLLEYTQALSEQSTEAVATVIDTLLDVGQERAVPALCLMSQAEDEDTATEALTSLGQMRYPAAVLGLQALLPVLPPHRRALGERSLRKLQLSGVPVCPLPPPDPAWRTLVSPVDGHGTQIVWFIRDPDDEGRCRFLGASLDDVEGFVQAYGNHNMPARALPTRQRPGYVHRVPMQLAALPAKGAQRDTSFLYMLETDLDYGRRLVRSAQARHFERGDYLPGLYRLLSPLIWQYEAASIDESPDQLPAPAQMLDLLAETASLPYHPFFRGWFIDRERAEGLAKSAVSLIPSADHEVVRTWASRLAGQYFDDMALRRIEARLRVMSEWLWRAEQVHLVELATVAAETIRNIPPTRHPFALSMAELGLNLAIHSLQ